MDDRNFPQEFEAEAKADRPATPLENAMMELEREQGELYEACSILADKLRGVLKVPYGRDKETMLADAPSKDVDMHSPLVRQISSCANRTRSTRDIIKHLTKSLEV